MATKRAKASLKEINAYLDLLGETANSFNKLKIDIDKSMNIVDLETNEKLFSFEVLPLEKKKVLVPDYVEEENEFSEPVQQETENEFSDVGDKPIFVEVWQPNKGDTKILVFLGAGRTLKSKKGTTLTWLFYDSSINDYILVPQWSCMNYFGENSAIKADVNTRYQITYLGKIEPKDGNSFHSARILKGKPVALGINHDWTRLLSDFE